MVVDCHAPEVSPWPVFRLTDEYLRDIAISVEVLKAKIPSLNDIQLLVRQDT